VSANHNNNPYQSLGMWCINQRRIKKYSGKKFNPDRLRKLNQIGFSWDIYDSAKFFDKRIKELVVFKKKYGNCDVPNKVARFNTLCAWCNAQKNKKKNNMLDPEHERILNKLGFTWDSRDKLFETNYANLLKYYKAHGHSMVLRTENLRLSEWCDRMRRRKKDKIKCKRLTPDMMKRLDAVKFNWDDPAVLAKKNSFERWNKNFLKLKQYKEKYGNFDVKERIDYSLHSWMMNQRRFYKDKSSYLKPDRKKLLNDIGFNWTLGRGKSRRINDADLFVELKRIYSLLNNTIPKPADIKKLGKYTPETYKNHFGTIANACKLAGVISGDKVPFPER
jgi:hypothetical protein